MPAQVVAIRFPLRRMLMNVMAFSIGLGAISGAVIARSEDLKQASPASAPVTPALSERPLAGIAQITIRVSDLRRAASYYEGVLGFHHAFDVGEGGQHSSYYKVNDSQFLELVPSLKPGEIDRQARIVFETSDIEELRGKFAALDAAPGAIRREADGNRVFQIVAPNGFPFDFKQYDPGSRQVRLRGRLLGKGRIATHLIHAGTLVTDEATRAFLKRLGLTGVVFGERRDYLETPETDRNLETKNPPLDPDNPATRAQYLRELHGATNHFALEVADMHAVREELKRRGGYDDVRLRTAVGNNRHWLIHLFDPDGSRTEFMSRDVVADDVPSFSVMPPGPPAPPIRATQKGVYPWP
ncbi:MAG: VOC family protein [Sphingobium sp.]|nr:VOC family protein [Sphingobium sp.]